jgi:hypothetical protein
MLYPGQTGLLYAISSWIIRLTKFRDRTYLTLYSLEFDNDSVFLVRPRFGGVKAKMAVRETKGGRFIVDYRPDRRMGKRVRVKLPEAVQSIEEGRR